MTTHKTKIQI